MGNTSPILLWTGLSAGIFKPHFERGECRYYEAHPEWISRGWQELLVWSLPHLEGAGSSQAVLQPGCKEGWQVGPSPGFGNTRKRQQPRDWWWVALLAWVQHKGVGPVWCWLINPPGAPITLMQALSLCSEVNPMFSDVLHCTAQSVFN